MWINFILSSSDRWFRKRSTWGGATLASINVFSNGEWTTHAGHGPINQLQPNRPYEFEVVVKESNVTISLDGIRIVKTQLPFVLPRGQIGIWAMGNKDISITKIRIDPLKPKIFVIMQFTTPFNELYTDVILPVGNDLGFQVIRADETFGPGIIIADIERQINESTAVIADITPNNPNVYWEVGYSHALKKPTILIAEGGTDLPFDVSPFRTLFYENSIAGKACVEEGLKKHIEAIQSEWLAV